MFAVSVIISVKVPFFFSIPTAELFVNDVAKNFGRFAFISFLSCLPKQ